MLLAIEDFTFYDNDAWTSNMCYGLNFYCRDMKFSDIVPNTTTIINKNSNKYEKNLEMN